MANFFGLRAAAPGRRPTAGKLAMERTEQKKSTSQQKQSLILLEEVDVLYEQDKQFWATVTALIKQSKRPFILTCNDETLVPLQSLRLHGIFRFFHPPTPLAVDHLLLMAANEGHVLARDAVESLYMARNQDLRGSIFELDFWCQIGVGDQRGGLSWYQPHQPRGLDCDGRGGNIIQVVSEGTYREGMGWFCRDNTLGSINSNGVEEHLLTQCWDDYQLDLGQWQDTLDMEVWAEDVAEADGTHLLRLNTLKQYAAFSWDMSDADTFACRCFATANAAAVDCTLPGIYPGMGDDFTVGSRLLDAEPLGRYVDLAMLLATSTKSLARGELARRCQPATPDDESAISAIDEANATSHIRTRHLPKIWDPAVDRTHMAQAFDPIAASDAQFSLQPATLDPSVFDGTMKIITLEVAPFVRRIVWYDQQLREQRLRQSDLLSEGGGGGRRQGKRMRTTRSAYSAIEGGSRRTTRRDRYFGDMLNSTLVLGTAGDGWNNLAVPGQTESPAPQASGRGHGQDEMDESE